MMRWYRYKFYSKALHIGDRYKGGIYKPTVDYIRATTVTFALRKIMGDNSIYAFGKEINGLKKIMVRNPVDRESRTGRASGDRGPVHIEYFEDANGEIYVNKDIGDRVELVLGGFKSIGFGVTELTKVGEVDSRVGKGYLATVVPIQWSDEFEIRREIAPIYGYVFMPDDITGGRYVKSLMPGSYIAGIDILLNKSRGRGNEQS